MESKGFLKSKKVTILIVFILSTVISIVITFLIKYLNYNWNEVNDMDMEVCERINQDMINLPFLAIAVKEKMTNEAFYNEFLRDKANNIYNQLVFRPSRSYYSGIFSKNTN